MEGSTSLVTAIILAVEEGSEQGFAWLAQQLQQTTDIAIMVRIALAFRDAGRVEYLPFVVEKLTLPATCGYRAQLVYACDVFDCTAYFPVFVSLALHDTYHTSWYALDVIGQMRLAAIPESDLQQAIRDAEAVMVTQDLGKKSDGVRRLLAFLRKHQKRREKKS